MSSNSAIIYPAQVTQTGANNFSPAAATYDFTDTFGSLAANQYILLRSWYYHAPASAAHDFTLWQGATPNGTPSNLWGVINASTGITNAESTCPVEILKTSAGATWVLMALTASGKDQAGTLTISYSVETR